MCIKVRRGISFKIEWLEDLLEIQRIRIPYLTDCYHRFLTYYSTVKPVLSRLSKIDKTKVLKTNGSLMKVESIAECSLDLH